MATVTDVEEGSPSPAPAVIDLEEVFADGFTRYQLAMAATQLGRAVAYRQSLPTRARWVNVAAAGIGCYEAVRRRRRAISGDTAPLAEVLPTGIATAMTLASTPTNSGGGVPRAALWAHLQPQWAAAGVSVFARSPTERVRGLVAAVLPYAVGPGRRKVVDLGAATRIGVGFVSFVSIAEVLARRLRATALQIDQTVARLVEERGVLAQRLEDERLRAEVLERTAAEMEVIRDLVTVDRPAAALRAAAEESLLRGWVSGDTALFAAAPWVTDEGSVAEAAVERLDMAGRRIETVFRVAATGPLVVHAALSGDRATRLLAAAALTHAVGVGRELRRPVPRRIAVAVSDVTMVAVAVALEARVQSALRSGGTPSTPPETLFGYAASIAPCAGTVNADPGPARAVTAALAVVLGGSALGVRGSWSERLLLGSERIVMAAGGSRFTHWVRDVIVIQTERLGEATEALAAARADAAAAGVRQRTQTLVHDSALQVMQWVQKPDLRDDQLLEWLAREIERLRQSARGLHTVTTQPLSSALADLAEGFQQLDMHPDVAVAAGGDDLAPAVTTALVEVVNEALTNVYKHSEDRAPRVRVRALPDLGMVELSVLNVRAGDTEHPNGARYREGTGTAGMRARVDEFGGTFDASVEGGRFVVRVRVPSDAPDARGRDGSGARG